ncbi:hypothetical protein A33Q_2723 [Indibacter alkaliphilus LW1]|uniref:PDZ domain-containing protein n=1 Tax=Indibacter alkaliphilus (strain CCUG 57479 / KCTC 22604 / LW1) TaxID=1189612 RepID=S2DGC2_INDAL|nr:aspartyl protease family protein [Indibacter alkaliphilus]EOZ96130.1 hypothetical protein A33Q_2723 [Indibacter alkaliphilus LW1]
MILKSILYGFLLHVLFLNFSFGQIPGFYAKKEARKTELPFLASNNLIILPVSINDGPPVNFLLDTGVKTNILFSKTLGDELEMQYTRKLNLMGADGQTVLTANVSPTNHLDLGPLEGISQTVLVLDSDFFELEAVIGIPVFGVLGHEFFKYNPVKIDYDKNIITFYETEALKWRPFGYRKIPMRIENGKPYINGFVRQISGQDLDAKLLIDLGANHGLLLNMETSDAIQLPPKFIKSDLGRSLGGDLSGYIGRVRSARLGGLKFKDVITSFPEETEFSYVIKESGRQGSIGSEMWGKTKIILDYRRERLLFKKGQKFNVPFEYDMSGIMPRRLPTDDLRYVANSVREDSPAYLAGVRAGDEIVSINSIPADFWELPDIVKLLRSEPDREIRMSLKRYRSDNPDDFELINVSFILERQI